MTRMVFSITLSLTKRLGSWNERAWPVCARE